MIWPNTENVHHETPKVISFIKCYIWANGDHQGLPPPPPEHSLSAAHVRTKLFSTFIVISATTLTHNNKIVSSHHKLGLYFAYCLVLVYCLPFATMTRHNIRQSLRQHTVEHLNRNFLPLLLPPPFLFILLQFSLQKDVIRTRKRAKTGAKKLYGSISFSVLSYC